MPLVYYAKSFRMTDFTSVLLLERRTVNPQVLGSSPKRGAVRGRKNGVLTVPPCERVQCAGMGSLYPVLVFLRPYPTERGVSRD